MFPFSPYSRSNYAFSFSYLRSERILYNYSSSFIFFIDLVFNPKDVWMFPWRSFMCYEFFVLFRASLSN